MDFYCTVIDGTLGYLLVQWAVVSMEYHCTVIDGAVGY
jgi:hypothetical protein